MAIIPTLISDRDLKYVGRVLVEMEKSSFSNSVVASTSFRNPILRDSCSLGKAGRAGRSFI